MKKKLIKKFFKQFGNPQGYMGEIVGWILSFKNKKRNSLAVEKLDIKPQDKILEIGFGPGVTIKNILDNYEDVVVGGIDISEVMVKQASNRNKKYISQNKAFLKNGSVDHISFDDNYFDKVLAINVSLFFPNPIENFKEINRVLKSGGMLLNVFQPRMAKSKKDVLERAEKLKLQVKEAGFSEISIEIIELKPIDCIYLVCKK